MANPLVSVILPVRNGDRFLAAAIASVLAQDYHPYEIIVVDGQSADQTAAIAQSFEHVRYVRQMNHGIANAYNIGIESAKGEFIAFLAHDDLWEPDKLSIQVTYMLEHPEIQYTVARVKFFLQQDCAIPYGFRKALFKGDHIGQIMETLVVRRTAFDRIGQFDSSLSIAEDVDWFARAQDQHIPMAVMPQVLLHKRIHDANTSSNISVNNLDLLKIAKQSLERKRNQRLV